MSTYAGIVAFDGRAIDRGREDRAASALSSLHKGRTVISRLESATFVERIPLGQTKNAPAAADRDQRALFVASVRLDNREELARALGLAAAELAHMSDAALLRRVFERSGDAGVAQCLGAFAFAHWDAAARRLTLGRDCLGNRPLFYHRGPEFVCFASALGALLALPDVPREIDEVAVANFLAINLEAGPQTFYRGIERVPSRTMATINGNGAQRRAYWAPKLDTALPYRRDEEYIERARELFDLAVESATRDTPNVAIATSGGLDSSAIAATAARQGLAQSVTCFCMVAPPGTDVDVGPFRYFDERGKIQELARSYPQLDVKFIDTDRIHPKSADDTFYFARAHLPSLAPASFGAGLYLPEMVAAAGHRALLIGNYGNFGLSWSGRYSLVALLREGRWGALGQELRAVARESNHGVARTLAAEVLAPLAPAWLRRMADRVRGRDPDSVARYSALNPAFVVEHALVRQWRAQGFDFWLGPGDWNAKRFRAHRLFDYNQYSRDIRGLAEEIFGFEVRDPHGDRRLLEFLLAVPEPMYRRDGVPRAFARRVLADRLPKTIIDERRYGANTPTWFRSLDARRSELASEIERLEASPLASRLLDLPRLKRLIVAWPKDDNEAEKRRGEFRAALARGVHVGRFIRWVEGGNA